MIGGNRQAPIVDDWGDEIGLGSDGSCWLYYTHIMAYTEYVHIYRERDREIDRERERKVNASIYNVLHIASIYNVLHIWGW